MKTLFAKLGIHNRKDFWKFCLQFIKFGIVGVTNTFITLAVQYLLLALGLAYIAAYIIGFLTGVANSFLWNSRFVFKASQAGSKKRFLRLLLVNLLTLAIGTATLALQVEYLNISEKVAIVLNVLITTPINFIFAKFWVFRD